MDPCQHILRLLYLYAERVDAGDFDGIADLFAEAELYAGQPMQVFRGHAAITGLYRRSTRCHADGTPRTRHLVCNPVIDLDDNGLGASCRSTFVVLQATPELPLQAIIAGRYHDRFACTEGRWHFTRREMHPELAGNLSQHLLIPLPGHA